MRTNWAGVLLTGLVVASGCAADAGELPATIEAPIVGAEPTDRDPVDAGAVEAGLVDFDIDAPWVEHAAGDDCRCADGSPYSFASRTADPARVVLYFQGGGACYDETTCSFEDGTYKVRAAVSDITDNSEPAGIFDFANEANPLREWSFVFVPYCTGDLHIGDNVHRYGTDLVVNHNGFANASRGLDHLVEHFGDAREILVTGSSAGGVPSPLFGALVADQIPDASVAVLADASGSYADNPPVNAEIGALWGTAELVPDWPETQGLEPDGYSIPGLFRLAGEHNPDIRFARFDNAYDRIQASFSALGAVDGDDQFEAVKRNEAQIEAAGVHIHSYIAAGVGHTILAGPAFYTLETDGVSFLDWFTRYLAGDPVDDVVCADCGKPPPA